MTDQPQSLLPVFENLVIEAVARQFFQPVPTGIGGDGQLMWGSTPMAQLSSMFWQSYKTTILEQIIPQIDMEAVASASAKEIYAKLTSEPSRYSYDSDEGTKLRAEIRKRTIELVAEKRAAAIIEQMAAEDENRA